MKSDKTPAKSQHAKNLEAQAKGGDGDDNKDKEDDVGAPEVPEPPKVETKPAKKHKKKKKKKTQAKEAVVSVEPTSESKKPPRKKQSPQKAKHADPEEQPKEEEAEVAQEEAAWPTSFPKLLDRVEHDGVLSYKCQWGRGKPEMQTVRAFVDHYGERAVDRIMAYDRKSKVQFQVEAVVDHRLDSYQEEEYMLRWQGYPVEFDTWEPVADVWEPARDDAEKHKKEMITAYAGGGNNKKKKKKTSKK